MHHCLWEEKQKAGKIKQTLNALMERLILGKATLKEAENIVRNLT